MTACNAFRKESREMESFITCPDVN